MGGEGEEDDAEGLPGLRQSAGSLSFAAAARWDVDDEGDDRGPGQRTEASDFDLRHPRKELKMMMGQTMKRWLPLRGAGPGIGQAEEEHSEILSEARRHLLRSIGGPRSLGPYLRRASCGARKRVVEHLCPQTHRRREKTGKHVPARAPRSQLCRAMNSCAARISISRSSDWEALAEFVMGLAGPCGFSQQAICRCIELNWPVPSL